MFLNILFLGFLLVCLELHAGSADSDLALSQIRNNAISGTVKLNGCNGTVARTSAGMAIFTAKHCIGSARSIKIKVDGVGTVNLKGGVRVRNSKKISGRALHQEGEFFYKTSAGRDNLGMAIVYIPDKVLKKNRQLQKIKKKGTSYCSDRQRKQAQERFKRGDNVLFSYGTTEEFGERFIGLKAPEKGKYGKLIKKRYPNHLATQIEIGKGDKSVGLCNGHSGSVLLYYQREKKNTCSMGFLDASTSNIERLPDGQFKVHPLSRKIKRKGQKERFPCGTHAIYTNASVGKITGGLNQITDFLERYNLKKEERSKFGSPEAAPTSYRRGRRRQRQAFR